jgi:hypothetical protein
MKKYLLSLFIIILGCENENPIDPIQELEGTYKSTTFIEPGSHDGGIDIHAAGGFLTIEFKNNSNFTAERFIPDTLDSNYPGGKILFEGAYSLKNDSIMFNLGEFFIDHLVWNTDKNELKYEVVSRGLVRIILQNQ